MGEQRKALGFEIGAPGRIEVVIHSAWDDGRGGLKEEAEELRLEKLGLRWL